ncbi:DUF4232 domain-containing protein [Streptomyces sp. NPDC012888]|uniref:DUF4232 domain-containing protein n=1 Tax=Streptomyces sp. NPDC012888 TaxID=3364855 RepID=UPI0036B7484B
MRIARNRWKTRAATAAAVAALLASTACQAGGEDDAKSPTPSATTATTGAAGTPAPTATATASATAPGTPSATAGTPQGPGGGSKSPTGGAGAATTACNDNDLSLATSFWRMDSGQNLLITATNLTDRPCTLYHYPYIGFGEPMDGPIGPIGARPQAVATIGPKEKAYAGLYLFRGGEPTTAVRNLSVGYQDRAPGSNRDVASLDIGLPDRNGFLNIGAGPRTTYWHEDLRAVEDVLFRSGDR